MIQLLANMAPARGPSDHLSLATATADAGFAHALAQLAKERNAEMDRTIPIPAADGRPPMIMRLISIRGRASEQLPDASAILMVIPVVPAEVPAADLLQGLFD